MLTFKRPLHLAYPPPVPERGSGAGGEAEERERGRGGREGMGVRDGMRDGERPVVGGLLRCVGRFC